MTVSPFLFGYALREQVLWRAAYEVRAREHRFSAEIAVLRPEGVVIYGEREETVIEKEI